MSLFEIEEDDVQRRRAALATLLETMDVPKMRQDVSQHSNIRWLNRNLAIQNASHPMFQTANDLVCWLIKWHSVQFSVVSP
jgi:hypothetical protein